MKRLTGLERNALVWLSGAVQHVETSGALRAGALGLMPPPLRFCGFVCGSEWFSVAVSAGFGVLTMRDLVAEFR